MPRAYKVLACTSAEAEPRLRAALPADALTMALTYREAMAALSRERFDVILIGMLFDESRALELMQTIAASPALPKTPILGIRGAKFRREVHPEVFDLPMKALGAAGVLDFGSIPDDAAGNAEIGERIRACISAPAE